MNNPRYLSLSIGEVFKPSDDFFVLPLDLLQHIHVFLVLRILELVIVLRAGSHKSSIEKENHLSWPAGYIFYDAAYDS